MAVTFVIGNAHRIRASLLQPGTTISASLANEFTEAVGDLYLSSLIALGLILFVITFCRAGDRQAPADPQSGSEARPEAEPMTLYDRRRLTNDVVLTLSVAATAFGLLWLVLVLWTLV